MASRIKIEPLSSKTLRPAIKLLQKVSLFCIKALRLILNLDTIGSMSTTTDIN